MVDPNAESELRSAIELFYFAYRAFTARPDHILERRGLARVHHRILYFVGRNPSISINALLATLRVSKQALNAPLRQLLGMKLVAASIPREDRRVRQLTLTPEGRRLETQLTATQMKHLAQSFAGAGGEAAEAWHRVMREVCGRS
jgi:DNA-binding MarR family transcriptional regulator